MALKPLVECSFLIPRHKDKSLSNGGPHDPAAWNWFDTETLRRFGGVTHAPGIWQEFWKQPDSGEIIHDESRRYTRALPAAELDELRGFLRQVCRTL
jgi:hypothetical protein